MIFYPDRSDARAIFFQTWQKMASKTSLTPLELMVKSIINQHPEYHGLIANPQDVIDHDWSTANGETNPFLHMSLHLAIEEQLSIDQPSGIRLLYQQLVHKTNDPSGHEAQHEFMDGLVEMIWTAQRLQKPMDPSIYLNHIHKKLGYADLAPNPIS